MSFQKYTPEAPKHHKKSATENALCQSRALAWKSGHTARSLGITSSGVWASKNSPGVVWYMWLGSWRMGAWSSKIFL